MMSRNPDILFITEYIKNVLYFATVRQGKVLKNTSDIHYFCIDNDLLYENYYNDFGPLNLGCLYKYCNLLNEKLKLYANKQSIVHYTTIDPKRKANAAYLLGCYGVLYLNLTPKEAMKPLTVHGQTYRAFQDATQGDSMYTITIIDCLHAIRKAKEVGFFNFQDFDYEEYERLDKIQGGDLNWIVPGKFLAFIGPVDYSVSLYHPPEMYIDYFLENNVRIVIRLNKRMYDANVFNNVGIIHYDLFFPDGSCPPRHILFKFLQISEEEDGALAVHCKAGLGRTGSLIGCYLMKHYRMTAHEAIGWMRICRPGSVIGHQQSWLEQLEPWLIKQGNLYRKRTFQDIDKLPIHAYGVYSVAEKMRRVKPMVVRNSSSPPIQRQTRSDITPSIRSHASKPSRDAPNKIPSEKEQCEWRVKTSKLQNQKVSTRGLPPQPALGMTKKDSVAMDHVNSGVLRRGFAGGEPRSTVKPLQKSSSKVIHNNRPQLHPRDKIIEQPKSNYRNLNVYPQVLTVPTYTTSSGPMIKSMNEAKNFLLRTKIFKDQREKHLDSALTITSQSKSYRPAKPFVDQPLILPNTQTSNYSTPRNSTQPLNRRRLGRSPSPSPCTSPTRGSITDHSRATNTQPMDKAQGRTGTSHHLHRDASKSGLREALSRLKLITSHERAGSVGVASLGARRDAPSSNNVRAPSVRSDERTLATQGDMLNSIKFQRCYRDLVMHPSKNFGLGKDNPDGKCNRDLLMTPSKPIPGLYKDNHTKGPPVAYISSMSGHGYSGGRDKNASSSSKPFNSCPRPSSPKGRTRQPQVPIHYSHYF